MNQLFRQNPFLRIAFFFGIGVYFLNTPIYFFSHLTACIIGSFLLIAFKSKIYHSACLVGLLLLLGSAQQFVINDNEKKEFLSSTPITNHHWHNKESNYQSLFEKFTQHHNNSTAALMVALLVGETQYLQQNMRQEYKSLGLSHLLAVSGMHIGLIFQFAVLLLMFLSNHRFPKWAVLSGLCMIWCFTGICQFSPSLLRASIMFTIIHLGKLMNQKSGAINALGISFVLMLILQPRLQYHWGFILSHLAVLGIILHHRRWQYLTENMPSWKRWVIQSLAITFGAQLYTSLFLLPITLQLPTYFLISNFFLVPYFSLLLFTCFGEWVFCYFWPALPFHVVNEFLFQLLAYFLQIMENLPILQMQIHESAMLVFGATLVLVILYYHLLNQPRSRAILFGLIGINGIMLIHLFSHIFSKPTVHLWRYKNEKQRLWSYQNQGALEGTEKRTSTFLIQKGVEFKQSP